MPTATVPQHASSLPPLAAGDVLYEVIDGQVVEKPPMGVRANRMAFKLAIRLERLAESNALGRSFVEQIYVLPLQGGERHRRPDVSFVSFSRWPAAQPLPDPDPWHVVPDLAVEVVSQSNGGEDLIEKIDEYFEAGVRLVWVIYPVRQRVHVYESPTQIRGLRLTDTLEGGTVLPGFQLPVKELFAE